MLFTRVIELALIECSLYQRQSYKRNKEQTTVSLTDLVYENATNSFYLTNS